VREIAFIQAFRNYLEITAGDKKYVLRFPLKDFSEQLPAELFFQTHRSYIVNLSKIEQIGGNFVGVGAHEVPLSRKVRNEVMTRLKHVRLETPYK
jgi:DNA-binding LytR/AlgR family response regulator